MTTLDQLSQNFEWIDSTNIGESIKTFEEILLFNDISDEGIKLREKAIYRLAAIFAEKRLVEELINLTKSVLPLLRDIP